MPGVIVTVHSTSTVAGIPVNNDREQRVNTCAARWILCRGRFRGSMYTSTQCRQPKWRSPRLYVRVQCSGIHVLLLPSPRYLHAAFRFYICKKLFFFIHFNRSLTTFVCHHTHQKNILLISICATNIVHINKGISAEHLWSTCVCIYVYI